MRWEFTKCACSILATKYQYLMQMPRCRDFSVYKQHANQWAEIVLQVVRRWRLYYHVQATNVSCSLIVWLFSAGKRRISLWWEESSRLLGTYFGRKHCWCESKIFVIWYIGFSLPRALFVDLRRHQPDGIVRRPNPIKRAVMSKCRILVRIGMEQMQGRARAPHFRIIITKPPAIAVCEHDSNTWSWMQMYI